jgi:CHAD domain-containing protein
VDVKDRKVRVAAGTVAAGPTVAAGRVAVNRLGGESERDPKRARAYRLRADEPEAEGVRRIALGRVDSAIGELSERTGDDFSAAIHEARKDLKKVRAVLRLVRDELGADPYRAQNARFRDAGRLLSGARDAEVKLGTLASLEEHYGDALDRAHLTAYRAVLSSDRDRAEASADEDSQGHLAEALRELESARSDVEDWPLESRGWDLFAGGLGRSYVRGRRAFQAIAQDPTDENVHEWRKRVKDLWYHLRILRGIRPEFTEPAAEEAHELSDLLGDHHDLTVLRQDLEDRKDELGGAAPTAVLAGAIARRQDELLEPALTLGNRRYAEKRKAFVKRLGGYWGSWREDGR